MARVVQDDIGILSRDFRNHCELRSEPEDNSYQKPEAVVPAILTILNEKFQVTPLGLPVT